MFLLGICGIGLLRLWFVFQEHAVVDVTATSPSLKEDFLYEEYVKANGFAGLVAASRNGKRYYYPWCTGIKQIKKENAIWFATEKSAEDAGYTIAPGCEKL